MKKNEIVVSEYRSCDICDAHGNTSLAYYHGKTKLGNLANLCETHFKSFGIGLGEDKAVKLTYHPEFENE